MADEKRYENLSKGRGKDDMDIDAVEKQRGGMRTSRTTRITSTASKSFASTGNVCRRRSIGSAPKVRSNAEARTKEESMVEKAERQRYVIGARSQDM